MNITDSHLHLTDISRLVSSILLSSINNGNNFKIVHDLIKWLLYYLFYVVKEHWHVKIKLF